MSRCKERCVVRSAALYQGRKARRARKAFRVVRALLVLWDRRGRRAETERQGVRGLLEPRIPSYMRNLLDSFTADNVEVILVVLNELHDTAELVGKVKLNVQCSVLMDVHGLYQVNQQSTGKALDIAIL